MAGNQNFTVTSWGRQSSYERKENPTTDSIPIRSFTSRERRMIRFQRFAVFLLVAGLLITGTPVRRFAQQPVQTNPANPTTDKPQEQQQNPPQSPAQSPAQNPPGQPPSTTPPTQDPVRINTQLVQVDAVVTDKKGRH